MITLTVANPRRRASLAAAATAVIFSWLAATGLTAPPNTAPMLQSTPQDLPRASAVGASLATAGQEERATGVVDHSAGASLANPGLAFASYLAGNAEDQINSVALDSTGDAWIVGYTTSPLFVELKNGTLTGGRDAFVVKITADGAVAFGTYLGGDLQEVAFSVDVDSKGNAWVAGTTNSDDFPTPNGFQTFLGGATDSFIVKFTPTGQLVFGSYIGGSSFEAGSADPLSGFADVRHGPQDVIWVIGNTQSDDFPVTSGARPKTLGAPLDAFVVNLSSSGALNFSTCFGGTGGDVATDIAVDRLTGDAWVIGTTDSTNIPITANAFQASIGGLADAFAVRYPSSVTPSLASYLGGSLDEAAAALAIDSSSDAWLVGVVASNDFPVTTNAFQSLLGGNDDAFVVEVSGTTNALMLASYLGGNGDEIASGIAVDSTGDAWVAGWTFSTVGLATPGAFQTVPKGTNDVFFSKISPQDSLMFTSYLGGGGQENVVGTAQLRLGMSVDDSGRLWLAGSTSVGGTTPADNFPVTDDAFQPDPGGTTDAFVTSIDSTGSLSFSSYLGGSGAEAAEFLAIPPSGDVWFAGNTWGGNNTFPVFNAFQPLPGGGTAGGFVAELTSAAESFLRITTSSLPDGTVGLAYSAQLAATGGTPPFTWSISGGGLPDGLTLDSSTGVISGTPTATGASLFTARVADSFSNTATRALSIVVGLTAQLTIVTQSLPDGEIGVLYNQTLVAQGNTGTVTWSVTSGSLPSGLTLVGASGAISGTPTATGTSDFTVQAADSVNTATKALSLIINEALAIATTSLPDGMVGQSYLASIDSTGGVAPLTWSIQSGALPDGLSLGAGSGTITGTPTTSGTFAFTVAVTDANVPASVATQALSIVIFPAGLAITTQTLPHGIVGVLYGEQLSAIGGDLPYTWSLEAGALPPGLSLDQTGVISGTPTDVGSSTFTVQVIDSQSPPMTADQALTIVVDPAPAELEIVTTSLPDGRVSVYYNSTLQAVGGTRPYHWSLAGGNLPSGLTLAADFGTISGTPTLAGTQNFTVAVTDSATPAQSATQALSIAVIPEGLVIVTTSLPPGTVGAAYSQTLIATGGVPPYTWSVSGSLPDGLSLASASGTIAGTPVTNGTSVFTATVTDSQSPPKTASRPLAIIVGESPLQITTMSLLDGEVGAPYSQTLAAAGGSPPYTWRIAGGSLPEGLSLDGAAGVLSGTPVANGTSSFTVEVDDSTAPPGVAQRTFSLIVAPAQLRILTVSLPNATVEELYQATLAATGGVRPYTWTITAGGLPAGLSLVSATGAITGTPITAGVSNFTVRVRDSQATSQTAQQQLSITVNPAAVGLSIGGGSLDVAQLGLPFRQQLSATGGIAPYSWSITSGSLPDGLTLESASGVVSGTPTALATNNFTIQVVDSQAVPLSGMKAFSMSVYGKLTWLQIDQLRISFGPTEGRDSFVLRGTCNMWPEGTPPKTVTLNLDSTWSVVMDASSWKRVGRTSTYAAKVSGVTGRLTYWSKGTSKCLFTFIGSRQDLQADLPNLMNVPVRLRIGDSFDETMTTRLTLRGRVAKLTSVDMQPIFWVDKVSFTERPFASSRDGLLFRGRVFLQGAFDPTSDGLAMTVGPYSFSVPAGNFTSAGRTLHFAAPTPHGKLTVRLNTRTGALTVAARGIDLSEATVSTRVSLAVTNHDGTSWDYGVLMARNGMGTRFRY